MRVWATTDFEGFYPVGTCALAVADTEDEAREVLKLVISGRGLPDPKDFTLQEIDTSTKAAWVLLDGNY